MHTLVRSAGLADAKADVSVEIGTGPGRGDSIGVTGIPEASKDIGIIETTDGSIPFLALFRYLSPYRSNPKVENEKWVRYSIRDEQIINITKTDNPIMSWDS